ncbi:MAG TPA: response regulator, partial [Steroidobacter sp.]
MRVLVVEDQWLIATDLADALLAAGHQVIGPALDSTHALLLAASEHPQLALIDIDLERRGIGLEIAERMHSEHDTAVIFTTAQPTLARTCHWAFGLICKPYDVTEAAAAVDAVEMQLKSSDGALCV